MGIDRVRTGPLAPVGVSLGQSLLPAGLRLPIGPMERVNGMRDDVGRLVASYRALKRSTIEAMVTRGEKWDGARRENVAAWLGLLAPADPDGVQLGGAHAPIPAPRKISRERLAEMAQAIRRALPRCVVEVF